MRENVSKKVAPTAGADAIVVAQAELRSLIHRLADEVASFRGRALAAEARQRELEQALPADDPVVPPVDAVAGPEFRPENAVALANRVAELEIENVALRERLALAAERTTRLLERTRFLRQQQEQQQGEEVG